jgi:polyhydroxyalkanoate synthesis regulator phasin
LKGVRLPEGVVNEAKKLRMEGDSYREIAAKLNISSPSSLEPHLKGIPKGRKEGPTIIEVPVDRGQGKAEEKADRSGTRGEADETRPMVEAVMKLAQAQQSLVEELKAEREEGRMHTLTGASDSFTLERRMAIEDRVDKLEKKVAAERKETVEAFNALTDQVSGLRAMVFGLGMRK